MTKFLVFFGSILLVRTLSKSTFGTLTFIENIYGYIYIFAGLGLANGILRFLVIAKNPKEEYTYYRYIFKRGSLINLVLIVISTITISSITLNSNYDNAKYLVMLFLIALPFQFIIDINFFTLRAKLANKMFAILSLVLAVITIYGKYLSAYLYDLQGVIIFSILINAVFALNIYYLVQKRYFYGIEKSYLIDYEKNILNRYSLHYMFTNGIWVLFMLNDILLLNIFLGNPEVLAEYKVAYVLPANLAIISSAIGIFISPYFIKNENNNSWVLSNYKKVLGITVFAMGFICLIISIFAKEIILILFGEEYLNIVQIMRFLLIASFINNAFRYTTANLLASMGKIKINMTISIIGIIAQLILNIILIPRFGLHGVVYTNIIVYLVMAITIIIVFMKIYKVKSI